MRKILLAALALFVITGSGFAQNLPSYVPANGLVGWWPFNGNANDESGNNNNGNIVGAVLTEDRFGTSNSAASFFNVGDRVALNGVTLSDVSNYTISIWFNKAPGSGGGSLFCGSNLLTTNGLRLGIDGNNLAAWGAEYLAGSTWSYSDQTSKINSQWHLITAVLESTPGQTITYNNLKVYVDGILQTSYQTSFGNAAAVISPVNNGGLMSLIGNETWGSQESFKGLLDDIAIYNRALTQQEITALYQGGNTTANCLDLPLNLQQGLVGYWPFCGNALDESGNGNHGTVNGATLTADRFGNQGSAYGFDGINNFIEVPYSTQFNMQKSTWSFWMNKNVSGPVSGTFTVGYSDNDGHHISNIFSVDSSYCQIVGSTFPGIVNGAGYIPNNSWHMISFIYDQTANENNFTYFVDGIKSRTVTLLLPINFNSNSQLRFGVAANGLQFNPYHGSLDDIAIWNRALTPQEITQLYNQGICQQSITVTDTLLIHTGITSYNPIAYQNTLKVWPNPGNQDITIDAGNLSLMQGWKIKISNSLGQEVYPATLISQQQQLLDMSTWGGNGLYLLHLINPQGHITEVKKIVLAP